MNQFIQLHTPTSGTPIVVNVNAIASLWGANGHTKIDFIGLPDGTLEVKELPGQILALIPKQ